MSEEPPLRRSVREFMKHHGISRAHYFEIRTQAGIRPKGWDTLLSANEEAALLRALGREKRSDQTVRHIHDQPTIRTHFVAPPPKPSIDYEAQIRQASKAATSWRTVLEQLAEGHAADHKGRCKRCRAEAPCPTKRTLHRLNNELTEQMALADSGDLAEAKGPAVDQPDVNPAIRVRELYADRDRWRIAVVELTVDHMIEDGRGRCAHCPVGVPCDVAKAVKRINQGIARQIDQYATMGDAALDAALGKAKVTDYYEDDWGLT